ncbi:hypothetical protein H8N01_09560 [Streptomyces sp. AC536]|nr:hypothetical protein [Streptomyces buecherae]QNJ44391.1 hypothetical protein H7H31_17255 [Streptomyces buecherae]
MPPGPAGAPPPPFGAPPVPPAPPGPPVPLRAVAVGLLNLSGLGVGYALLRVWWAVAACWAATAGLLLLALPAEPDGVAGGVVAGYLVVLAAAAAHGAFLGLRRPLAWPPRAAVAVLLGLALLAAPGGGYLAYDSARDEATEEMLLDRLAEADELVSARAGQPFDAAEADYRRALDGYAALTDDHPGSRAAKRVPERMKTYYESVGATYDRRDFCAAIEPLTFLRTVPRRVDERHLGKLTGWPDDRLANSLYECGVSGLGQASADGGKTKHLGELLADFPDSAPAARVEPAVSAAISTAAGGIKGAEPCTAVTNLRTLSVQAGTLAKAAGAGSAALTRDAGAASGHVRAGTYACGVDQYQDGRFDAALTTMNDFARTYRDDGNRPRAQKIAIAAEIAKKLPDAGKRLPTTASGGGVRVTVKNDSPNAVEILYTGPVTGRFTLSACDGCTTYANRAQARDKACQSGKSYPQRTLSLPVGTTYFLHKSQGTSNSSGTDTARIEPGYTYTECAYAVSPFGIGPAT